MTAVISKVLTTVNAPYSEKVTAHELAAKVQDPASAASFDVWAFAFFSEVSPRLQREFLQAMGADPTAAAAVADLFSEQAGYKLPLIS